MQPATATVPAMPTKSLVATSDQKFPSYCATCTPLGKQCPTTYPIPLNPTWSNSEEEKDLKVPNEAEKEIADWDGDIQMQKKQKQLELNNNVTIPQSSPKSQSISTSDTDEMVVHTPQLTDTLVTSGNREQKDNLENEYEDSKDFNSEDTIDNIV